MNKSIMQCCICNNENTGVFININENKYHLNCIEQLQQENKKLKEQNKLLKNEIKIHSKKFNNRYKAIKTLENYISKLNLECQRYFDLLMIANEENQQLEEQLKIHTQPQIFIDTQDMEEQYSTDLYIDYLKTQLKQRDEAIDKAIIMLTINIELTKEQPSQDRTADKFILERYNDLLKILQKYKGDNK